MRKNNSDNINKTDDDDDGDNIQTRTRGEGGGERSKEEGLISEKSMSATNI